MDEGGRHRGTREKIRERAATKRAVRDGCYEFDCPPAGLYSFLPLLPSFSVFRSFLSLPWKYPQPLFSTQSGATPRGHPLPLPRNHLLRHNAARNLSKQSLGALGDGINFSLVAPAAFGAGSAPYRSEEACSTTDRQPV